MTPENGPSGNSASELTAEDHRYVREEFAPVAEKLASEFFDKAVTIAKDEGWQPELAEAVGLHGSAAFVQALIDGEEPAVAIETAMKRGRREVLEGLFKSEIESGKDRRSAFLRLLEINRENAARTGEEVQYPEAWVTAAADAVDTAAGQGGSLEDQMKAGYLSINRSAQAAAVDAALGY